MLSPNPKLADIASSFRRSLSPGSPLVVAAPGFPKKGLQIAATTNGPPSLLGTVPTKEIVPEQSASDAESGAGGNHDGACAPKAAGDCAASADVVGPQTANAGVPGLLAVAPSVTTTSVLHQHQPKPLFYRELPSVREDYRNTAGEPHYITSAQLPARGGLSERSSLGSVASALQRGSGASRFFSPGDDTVGTRGFGSGVGGVSLNKERESAAGVTAGPETQKVAFGSSVRPGDLDFLERTEAEHYAWRFHSVAGNGKGNTNTGASTSATSTNPVRMSGAENVSNGPAGAVRISTDYGTVRGSTASTFNATIGAQRGPSARLPSNNAKVSFFSVAGTALNKNRLRTRNSLATTNFDHHEQNHNSNDAQDDQLHAVVGRAHHTSTDKSTSQVLLVTPPENVYDVRHPSSKAGDHDRNNDELPLSDVVPDEHHHTAEADQATAAHLRTAKATSVPSSTYTSGNNSYYRTTPEIRIIDEQSESDAVIFRDSDQEMLKEIEAWEEKLENVVRNSSPKSSHKFVQDFVVGAGVDGGDKAANAGKTNSYQLTAGRTTPNMMMRLGDEQLTVLGKGSASLVDIDPVTNKAKWSVRFSGRVESNSNSPKQDSPTNTEREAQRIISEAAAVIDTVRQSKAPSSSRFAAPSNVGAGLEAEMKAPATMSWSPRHEQENAKELQQRLSSPSASLRGSNLQEVPPRQEASASPTKSSKREELRQLVALQEEQLARLMRNSEALSLDPTRNSSIMRSLQEQQKELEELAIRRSGSPFRDTRIQQDSAGGSSVPVATTGPRRSGPTVAAPEAARTTTPVVSQPKQAGTAIAGTGTTAGSERELQLEKELQQAKSKIRVQELRERELVKLNRRQISALKKEMRDSARTTSVRGSSGATASGLSSPAKQAVATPASGTAASARSAGANNKTLTFEPQAVFFPVDIPPRGASSSNFANDRSTPLDLLNLKKQNTFILEDQQLRATAPAAMVDGATTGNSTGTTEGAALLSRRAATTVSGAPTTRRSRLRASSRGDTAAVLAEHHQLAEKAQLQRKSELRKLWSEVEQLEKKHAELLDATTEVSGFIHQKPYGRRALSAIDPIRPGRGQRNTPKSSPPARDEGGRPRRSSSRSRRTKRRSKSSDAPARSPRASSRDNSPPRYMRQRSLSPREIEISKKSIIAKRNLVSQQDVEPAAMRETRREDRTSSRNNRKMNRSSSRGRAADGDITPSRSRSAATLLLPVSNQPFSLDNAIDAIKNANSPLQRNKNLQYLNHSHRLTSAADELNLYRQREAARQALLATRKEIKDKKEQIKDIEQRPIFAYKGQHESWISSEAQLPEGVSPVQMREHADGVPHFARTTQSFRSRSVSPKSPARREGAPSPDEPVDAAGARRTRKTSSPEREGRSVSRGGREVANLLEDPVAPVLAGAYWSGSLRADSPPPIHSAAAVSSVAQQGGEQREFAEMSFAPKMQAGRGLEPSANMLLKKASSSSFDESRLTSFPAQSVAAATAPVMGQWTQLEKSAEERSKGLEQQINETPKEKSRLEAERDKVTVDMLEARQRAVLAAEQEVENTKRAAARQVSDAHDQYKAEIDDLKRQVETMGQLVSLYEDLSKRLASRLHPEEHMERGHASASSGRTSSGAVPDVKGPRAATSSATQPVPRAGFASSVRADEDFFDFGAVDEQRISSFADAVFQNGGVMDAGNPPTGDAAQDPLDMATLLGYVNQAGAARFSTAAPPTTGSNLLLDDFRQLTQSSQRARYSEPVQRLAMSAVNPRQLFERFESCVETMRAALQTDLSALDLPAQVKARVASLVNKGKKHGEKHVSPSEIELLLPNNAFRMLLLPKSALDVAALYEFLLMNEGKQREPAGEGDVEAWKQKYADREKEREEEFQNLEDVMWEEKVKHHQELRKVVDVCEAEKKHIEAAWREKLREARRNWGAAGGGRTDEEMGAALEIGEGALAALKKEKSAEMLALEDRRTKRLEDRKPPPAPVSKHSGRAKPKSKSNSKTASGKNSPKQAGKQHLLALEDRRTKRLEDRRTKRLDDAERATVSYPTEAGQDEIDQPVRVVSIDAENRRPPAGGDHLHGSTSLTAAPDGGQEVEEPAQATPRTSMVASFRNSIGELVTDFADVLNLHHGASLGDAAPKAEAQDDLRSFERELTGLLTEFGDVLEVFSEREPRITGSRTSTHQLQQLRKSLDQGKLQRVLLPEQRDSLKAFLQNVLDCADEEALRSPPGKLVEGGPEDHQGRGDEVDAQQEGPPVPTLLAAGVLDVPPEERERALLDQQWLALESERKRLADAKASHDAEVQKHHSELDRRKNELNRHHVNLHKASSRVLEKASKTRTRESEVSRQIAEIERARSEVDAERRILDKMKYEANRDTVQMLRGPRERHTRNDSMNAGAGDEPLFSGGSSGGINMDDHSLYLGGGEDEPHRAHEKASRVFRSQNLEKWAALERAARENLEAERKSNTASRAAKSSVAQLHAHFVKDRDGLSGLEHERQRSSKGAVPRRAQTTRSNDNPAGDADLDRLKKQLEKERMSLRHERELLRHEAAHSGLKRAVQEILRKSKSSRGGFSSVASRDHSGSRSPSRSRSRSPGRAASRNASNSPQETRSSLLRAHKTASGTGQSLSVDLRDRVRQWSHRGSPAGVSQHQGKFELPPASISEIAREKADLERKRLEVEKERKSLERQRRIRGRSTSPAAGEREVEPAPGVRPPSTWSPRQISSSWGGAGGQGHQGQEGGDSEEDELARLLSYGRRAGGKADALNDMESFVVATGGQKQKESQNENAPVVRTTSSPKRDTGPPSSDAARETRTESQQPEPQKELDDPRLVAVEKKRKKRTPDSPSRNPTSLLDDVSTLPEETREALTLNLNRATGTTASTPALLVEEGGVTQNRRGPPTQQLSRDVFDDRGSSLHAATTKAWRNARGSSGGAPVVLERSPTRQAGLPRQLGNIEKSAAATVKNRGLLMWGSGDQSKKLLTQKSRDYASQVVKTQQSPAARKSPSPGRERDGRPPKAPNGRSNANRNNSLSPQQRSIVGEALAAFGGGGARPTQDMLYYGYDQPTPATASSRSRSSIMPVASATMQPPAMKPVVNAPADPEEGGTVGDHSIARGPIPASSDGDDAAKQERSDGRRSPSRRRRGSRGQQTDREKSVQADAEKSRKTGQTAGGQLAEVEKNPSSGNGGTLSPHPFTRYFSQTATSSSPGAALPKAGLGGVFLTTDQQPQVAGDEVEVEEQVGESRRRHESTELSSSTTPAAVPPPLRMARSPPRATAGKQQEQLRKEGRASAGASSSSGKNKARSNAGTGDTVGAKDNIVVTSASGGAPSSASRKNNGREADDRFTEVLTDALYECYVSSSTDKMRGDHLGAVERKGGGNDPVAVGDDEIIIETTGPAEVTVITPR